MIANRLCAATLVLALAGAGQIHIATAADAAKPAASSAAKPAAPAAAKPASAAAPSAASPSAPAAPVVNPAIPDLPPEQVAKRLEYAVARSPEAFTMFVMSIWDPNGASVYHDPSLPGDGVLKVADFAKLQPAADIKTIFSAPDVHHEAVAVKVDGNVISLSYNQVMTINGERISVPLKMALTVRAGILRNWTIYLTEEMKQGLAKRRAASEAKAAP